MFAHAGHVKMANVGSTSDFIAGSVSHQKSISRLPAALFTKGSKLPAKVPQFVAHSAGSGRVRAICFSDAELDCSLVTVLGCGSGCCIRLRRRTLVYLLASAVIALTSVDAFSNPAHKQAASHPSKAVKAENHKHRVGTQGSHRKRTAKAENHKHQSQTEA